MNVSELSKLMSNWTGRTQSSYAANQALFTETLKALSSAAKAAPSVFYGAPDFVREWAEKYDIDFYKEAIVSSLEGGRQQAMSSSTLRLTVTISPAALARMERDAEYRKEVEKEIEEFWAMNKDTDPFAIKDYEIKGFSLTIHTDGTISETVYMKKLNDDYGSRVAALMNQVDEMNEETHKAIEERIKRQREEELLQKADAERRRQRVFLAQDTLGMVDPMRDKLIERLSSSAARVILL